MNKFSYLFLAGILSFGLISCKEDAKEQAAGSNLDDITTEITNQTVENTGEVMLNPPHGEPGHICEIPVGQPLPNSGTTATTAPKVTNTTAEIKLNPPHGEPGHICEIPVGQPLPTDGAARTQVQPVQNVNLKTPLMKQNQRLNPPHGQPGHICEIPVGQPLP